MNTIGQPPLRVWLFEDDDQLRSLLQGLLEDRGYQVLSYADPALCPLHFEATPVGPTNEGRPDVIVTDQNMKWIRGLDFVAELKRKGSEVKHMAVLSGRLDDALVRHAVHLGCRCSTKPKDLPALFGWLDNVQAQVLFEAEPGPVVQELCYA